MIRTGPGPHRSVADGELRSIFYLTPQRGRSFMFTVTTDAFVGSSHPAVTPLLRAMLYAVVNTPEQNRALAAEINAKLAGRETIPIRAKLLSHMNLVRQQPWAFPALYDTRTCRAMHQEISKIAGISDEVASNGNDFITEAGIGAALVRYVSGVAALAWQSIRYYGGKSKDYYEFHARRIAEELALRGIPSSMLQ